MNKKVYVSEIIRDFASDIVCIYGEVKDQYVTRIDALENVDRDSLDWVNSTKKNKQEIAETSKARVIIVDKEVGYSEKIRSEHKILIVADKPKNLLAKVANCYFVSRPEAGIHSTAIIHPEAQIGQNVSIGPYSVIGKCNIGDDSVIDSYVRIYDNTMIGSNCTIQTSVVIGGEGFGFEIDENGNYFRFPQLGKVIIGNNVEVGAGTCIDRGALSDTIIENYTKINNLCHIAHNNHIGKNVVITGQVNISGSNIIRDKVWVGPNSTVRGFLEIGKNAVIGMGAVVTKNVPEGEIWMGNPARKMERWKD